MSDHELRTDSLEAGHRRTSKKPKPIKTSEPGKAPKRARGKSEKKAKGGPSFAQRLGGLAKPLAVPVRVARQGASKTWAVWDRAYDDAVARPVHAVKVFGIVVAAVAVLGGLCWFGTYHYSSLVAARGEATQQGEEAVGRLLSYNWRSIDRQVEKTQDVLTGKFKVDYAQFINTSIAPTAKNKQVLVQTSVDRGAVVSSSTSKVVMLMYLDQESEAQLNPDSGASVSGVRVTLEKEDGRWKVSELTPV